MIALLFGILVILTTFASTYFIKNCKNVRRTEETSITGVDSSRGRCSNPDIPAEEYERHQEQHAGVTAGGQNLYRCRFYFNGNLHIRESDYSEYVSRAILAELGRYAKMGLLKNIKFKSRGDDQIIEPPPPRRQDRLALR